jgi:hypothetical protein
MLIKAVINYIHLNVKNIEIAINFREENTTTPAVTFRYGQAGQGQMMGDVNISQGRTLLLICI